MKRKLLIALIAITAAICGVFGFAACGGGSSDNGTYYFVDIDGSIVKNSYYELNSGKWKNSDGESGSYETNGNKIIFYSEFMGEKEEWAKAVLDNGVLTVTDGLSKDKYISENHKHAYGEWETVSELSCTVDGVKERKCSCGIIDTDVTKCVGYHTGNWHTVKEATCTESGIREVHCTTCDKDITEEIEKKPHKLSDWLHIASEHYKICSECKKVFNETPHDDNDLCTVCGYPFTFKLNNEKTGYILTGYEKNTESLVIPKNFNGMPVIEIGNSAFEECNKLTGVTIPDSVSGIGYAAFQDCVSLTNINVDTNNKNYKSVDGNLYKKDGTELIRYAIGKIETSFAVPDSVTSIGWYAFYKCISLISVTIPDGVTEIGRSAFSGCSKLTSIFIPDSVTHIEEEAFNGCPIETATIPTLACSYINNTALKTVILTSGESIGRSAFSGCSKLTSIFIPDSVTSIGESAFHSCSALEEIKYKGDLKKWCSISGLGVLMCYSYSKSDKKLYINDKEVAGDLIIPDEATEISSYSFYGCSSLTSVSLPDSVTSIGYNAFEDCSSLKSVTIGDGVTSIGSEAFNNCGSLESITVSENNTVYASQNGVLYNKEKTEFIFIPNALTGDVIIPKGITSVYGFSGTLLTKVIISDGVTSIGSEAFYNCGSLTNVTIPDSVTSIGNDAFRSCNSLKSVTIHGGVTSIGDYAFSGCTLLASIIIPDSVQSIGKYAFNSCTTLTSVTIGNGVKSIGEYAFKSCPIETATLPSTACSYIEKGKLKTVKITSGTKINNTEFMNCTTLTSIIIPDSLISIGYDAFYKCSSLKSITISDGLISIGNEAFVGCSALKSITIPDSVTSIGNYAFQGCTTLTSATIGNGVKSIGELAFSNCYSLKSIAIPDSVTSIGNKAFRGCTTLTSVTIGDGVTSIGEAVFNNCSSLTTVTISNKVTNLDYDAFASCRALENINFKGTIKEWSAIKKDYFWDSLTGDYTVHCTDGDIEK